MFPYPQCFMGTEFLFWMIKIKFCLWILVMVAQHCTYN